MGLCEPHGGVGKAGGVGGSVNTGMGISLGVTLHIDHNDIPIAEVADVQSILKMIWLISTAVAWLLLGVSALGAMFYPIAGPIHAKMAGGSLAMGQIWLTCGLMLITAIGAYLQIRRKMLGVLLVQALSIHYLLLGVVEACLTLAFLSVSIFGLPYLLERFKLPQDEIKNMDQRLFLLIQDYQSAVARAVQLLEQAGIARPESNIAWACCDMNQSGVLADGVKFYKHGFGCAVHLQDGCVDFDFGANGEITGFDTWRLAGFAEARLMQYGFASEKELEECFQAEVKAGNVIYSGYILHYLNAC
jgi:hypothetical protein